MAPRGRTAKPMGLPAGSNAGSTSKTNAQVGSLKKRTKGMKSGDYPK